MINEFDTFTLCNNKNITGQGGMIIRPRRGQIFIARGAASGIKKNQTCFGGIFDGEAENCDKT